MSTRRRRLRAVAPLVVAAMAFALLLGAAAPAFAAPAPYAQWRVALWPEYDDQRTLVIYEPQLDGSTALPFKFDYGAFPLDAQVGMTCQVTSAGEHQCQQRQTSVTADLQSISYTAPSERQLYMEYYTDMLKGERPTQRKMTYSFVAPADIADLQVSIRRPKDATGFTVTPKPTAQQTDGEGFTLDTFGFQNVKAGKKYDFTFAYSRPSWTPPVAKTQNNAQGGQNGAAPAGRTQQAGSGQTSQLFALIAVAAFIGAFVMLMMRRPATVVAPMPAKTASKGRKGGGGKASNKGSSAKGGPRGAPRKSGA